MDEFDITKAKKQIETEAKKLASRADNFKELEHFDMDKPGIIQTLAFVFLGFIQDLFLRQDKVDKRNLEIILNMNSTIIPPSKASGYVNFTGNIGGKILAGSIITDKKTKCSFTTLLDGTINHDSNTGTISLIEENYFLIKTDNNHNLSSGLTVKIKFPENPDLDMEEIIIAQDEKTLRIDKKINAEVLDANILVSLNRAFIPVESVENGVINNETDGVILTLEQSITDVNDDSYAYVLGITGGRDSQVIKGGDNAEATSGLFDIADIELIVKQLKGVTRVFVVGPDDYLTKYSPDSVKFLENIALITKEKHGSETNSRILVRGSTYPQFNGEFDILKIDENNFLYWMSNIPQGTPEPNELIIQGQPIPCGSFKVYFVKDGQENMLPSLAELTDAKEAIYANAPINISKQNIIVENPTLKPVNLTMTFVSPNTDEMKEAIKKALQEYFTSDKIALGSTIYKNDLISIINNVHNSKGEGVVGLQLLYPEHNITSELEELIVLGDISYV